MTAHARRTGPIETTGTIGTTETEQTAPEPRQHERLGPYRLLQRLGEGGMGVVHLALDPQGRAVAVKVLRPHIAYDPEARSRLEREVETLRRVRDSSVAAVIDSDIFGERPYLVTRYVPGPSLDEVVGEEGPLRGGDLLRLGRGLVVALEAIHAVGVVHRDLKPGNVLLEDGDPVLIDFGIAHVADDVRLTSVGLVMGTPGYLSPEVVAGGAVTEATDWWGWAATLTYAASGRPPFGRGPMDVVLDRVRRGESDLSGVDPRLQPLLEAALAPDPRRRPPVGEVVAALERYAAGRPATVALPPPATAPTPVPAPAPAPAPDRTSALPLAEPPWARAGGWPPPAGTGEDAAWGPDRGSLTDGPYAGRLADPWGDGPAEPWAEAYDDPDAEADAYPGADADPQAGRDPRIGRPMRTGTLVAVAAALAAAAASRPGVVVLVVLVWCWVARFSDRAVSALVVRRHERGRRRSDVPWAVAASPWHLVVSAVGAVVGLALPALVAAAGVVCASLGLRAAGLGAGGSPADVVGPSLAVGLLIGALVAWWGPGGAALRRGSRSVTRTLVPSGVVTQVVVVALVVGAVALASTAATHPGEVVWWPVTGDPLAPLLAP